MSVNYCERLAAGSAEDRETKLEQMRSSRHEGLAAESLEQREDRQQRDSESDTRALNEE